MWRSIAKLSQRLGCRLISDLNWKVALELTLWFDGFSKCSMHIALKQPSLCWAVLQNGILISSKIFIMLDMKLAATGGITKAFSE
jgi:hypothetical protein